MSDKTVEIWGREGDKLEMEVFVGRIQDLRNHFAAIRGTKTYPEHDVRDIDCALRMYDHILKTPNNFDLKKVMAMLAALPNTIAAKPVLGDTEVQIHLGLAYTYKDYSHLVDDKKVKEMVRVFPVQVFKIAPKVASDPWRDAVVTKFKMREISLVDRAMKDGIYTKCPGVAIVWGGTVEPCPHDDQPRIKDMPRIHCDACGTRLIKARAIMRKKGHVANGANNKRMLEDLLSKLD